MQNKQSGFSLIEVMVAVAIMAIMTAMIAPSLYNQLTKAESVRVESDLMTIETQAKFYYLDNYRLPNSINQLVPQYFNTVPTDPWGKDYSIKLTNKKYVVLSAGPDGHRGTKDDVVRVLRLRGFKR